MKLQKILFAVSVAFLLVSSAAAGDFDWLSNLSVRAEADPSGFRAQLASRFTIGDTEVNAVLGNVENPADAYIGSASWRDVGKAGRVCHQAV